MKIPYFKAEIADLTDEAVKLRYYQLFHVLVVVLSISRVERLCITTLQSLLVLTPPFPANYLFVPSPHSHEPHHDRGYLQHYIGFVNTIMMCLIAAFAMLVVCICNVNGLHKTFAVIEQFC